MMRILEYVDRIDNRRLLRVRVDEDGVCFCLQSPVRLFAERISLLLDGAWQEYGVAASAYWQHGSWMEEFRLPPADAWEHVDGIPYRLHGDRTIAGELRRVRT